MEYHKKRIDPQKINKDFIDEISEDKPANVKEVELPTYIEGYSSHPFYDPSYELSKYVAKRNQDLYNPLRRIDDTSFYSKPAMSKVDTSYISIGKLPNKEFWVNDLQRQRNADNVFEKTEISNGQDSLYSVNGAPKDYYESKEKKELVPQLDSSMNLLKYTSDLSALTHKGLDDLYSINHEHK